MQILVDLKMIAYLPIGFTKKIKEKRDMEEKDNKVNHPSHYNQGGIECIDAMESAYGTEAVIKFCMCNAFKYQWRFNEKNGREDILKCQWYQNKMVELQNKLNNKDKNI